MTMMGVPSHEEEKEEEAQEEEASPGT